MRRLLALFSEKRLHDAVAADTDLEKTGCRAAVTVTAVPVVAFLTGIKCTVSANRSGCNKRNGTARAAAVTVTRIAVIAFLTEVRVPVTAVGFDERRTRRCFASVIAAVVTVVIVSGSVGLR